MKICPSYRISRSRESANRSAVPNHHPCTTQPIPRLQRQLCRRDPRPPRVPQPPEPLRATLCLLISEMIPSSLLRARCDKAAWRPWPQAGDGLKMRVKWALHRDRPTHLLSRVPAQPAVSSLIPRPKPAGSSCSFPPQRPGLLGRPLIGASRIVRYLPGFLQRSGRNPSRAFNRGRRV
jgi:hypothetical protein